MQRLVLCSLLVALLPTWTAAQDSTANAVLDRIATYLDKSTIVVGYFDLKNVDPEKSVASLREIVDGSLKKSDMPKEMKDMLQPMFSMGFDAFENELKDGDSGKQWRQLQSSGMEGVYLIVNSMTMAQSPTRVLCVFDPSTETAKIDAMQEQLAAHQPYSRFQQKDGFIIVDSFSSTMTDAQVQDAEKFLVTFDKSRKPLIRPEFVTGMERTKSAPFKIVFAPDAALKGMIQMFYPMAPPDVQETLPVKTIFAGVNWISLGIDINRWIIDLNIKGESPEAAQALYDAVIKLKDDTMTQMSQDFGSSKELDAQIIPFIPKVQEDRLRLTINQKFLDDNLGNILQYALPAIMAAQSGGLPLPIPVQ